MKKYIIPFICSLYMLSACNDFLDIKPQDFTSPGTFYRNQIELEQALAATYNPLLEYKLNLSINFPMGTDEGCTRESSPGMKIYYYTHDASSAEIKAVWSAMYLGIDRANAFLENADQADCDQELIKRMKGEALFLRGYYHFILTAYWGDVPMKLSSTKSAEDVQTPCSPASEIYKQVITDMENSLESVASLEELGYGGKVNKAAVQGILARVCLHAAGRLGDSSYYSKARSWAWSLISSGNYRLNSDYKNIFIQLMQDKYETKESLFEVEFWSDDNNNDTNRQGAQFISYFGTNFSLDFVGTQGGESNARSRGTFDTTPFFYNAFEEGDLRRDWNAYDYSYKGYNTTTKVAVRPEFKFRQIGKYRREYEVNFPIHTWINSTNFPLLRYADVLLMFAEADNEVNNGTTSESLEAVNQVLRRAFGKDVNAPDPDLDKTAMSKEDFLKYIQNERMRELAFESHRKLDLLRWGILQERMKEVGDEIAAIPSLINGSKNPAVDGIVFPGIDYIVRTYTNFGTKHLLMPIPELELNVNKEIKNNNPGW